MKITIKNLQKRIPLNPKRLKRTILKVLSKEAANPVRARKSGVVTICFVNDRKIKELNLRFLHKNKPTDVLAFDGSGKNSALMFADIVISTDTAIRNAKIFKTSSLYEVYLYLVHGLLHLLGYDDRKTKQRRLMRQKEREYVNIQNRGISFT